MEISGIVKRVSQPQQVSARFRKIEIVVTTEEQYPQHILIEFQQDKCDLLNNIQIGEKVKVSINLRGREWVNPQGESKYFNSIQGWRIDSLSKSGYCGNGSAVDDFNRNQQQGFNQNPTYGGNQNYQQPNQAFGHPQQSNQVPKQHEIFNGNGETDDLPF